MRYPGGPGRDSEVFVGLVETHRLSCVDHEVARVDVVALQDLLEDLRLVNGALLHEANDLVLHHHGVVHIVVQLYLHLVLKLAVLPQEDLFVDWVGEVVSVLSQEVDFAVGGPGVEPVTHGVLCPDADVFATSEQQKSVDLFIQRLPVEHMRHPRQRVGQVEE